jgi:hypothetical protein
MRDLLLFEELQSDPPSTPEEAAAERDVTVHDVRRLGVTEEKARGFLRKSSKRSQLGDATPEDIARFANSRPWSSTPLEVLEEMASWRLPTDEESAEIARRMAEEV